MYSGFPYYCSEVVKPRDKPKASKKANPGRDKGATLSEIMKANGWQAHTIRGFVGILERKGGETIESSKTEGAERRYKIR